jgi:hypothetical protein
VVVGFAPITADPVASASVARSNIGFHADDRFYARFFSFFLEVPGSVEVAVVRDREGWLLEFESPVDEVVDPVGAVEK